MTGFLRRATIAVVLVTIPGSAAGAVASTASASAVLRALPAERSAIGAADLAPVRTSAAPAEQTATLPVDGPAAGSTAAHPAAPTAPAAGPAGAAGAAKGTAQATAHTTAQGGGKAPVPPRRVAAPAAKAAAKSIPPAAKPTKPAKAAAPAAPAAPTSAFAAIESQVIALTNAERVANGCVAVRLDGRLTVAARGHSADMVANNYFSHVSPSGSTFTSRAAAAGYPAALSENIAWGWPTAQAVMDAWMNSPGHRTNILNCAAVTVGVGAARKADGTMYWTEMFGRV